MSLYSQLARKIPLATQLRTRASYAQQLRAAVRGLWTGIFTAAQFTNAMQSTIDRGFRRAWAEGMSAVGLVFPDDMTDAEQTAFTLAVDKEYGFIAGLAAFVEANSKENGGKFSSLMPRVELWVKRYEGIKNQAKLSAEADPVLEWHVHADESCKSCLKLEGQRHRSSIWREKLEVWPQHPDLECMESAGGPDVCKCTLEKTDERPTRGRPPKWRFTSTRHLAGTEFDHDQSTHGSRYSAARRSEKRKIDEAYARGEALRGKYSSMRDMAYRAPPEDRLPYNYDLGDLVSFEAGLLGHDKPRLVTGWRWGRIPERGWSYNSRDSFPEPGVSLMATDDGLFTVDEISALFISFGRDKVRVEGWLHPFRRGSDGEPLVFWPRELGVVEE